MRKTVLTAAAAALLAAVPASAASGVFPAEPLQQSTGIELNLGKLPIGKNTVALRPKALDENGGILPDYTETTTYFQEMPTSGILYGPNDEEWFYTLVPDVEIITQNEYYTEYDYLGFSINVYDEKMDFIGQASGTFERPEGTKRCQSITIGTQLTRQFFKGGEEVEIMVIGNFVPKRGFGAKQVTFAYSLLPEGQETPCVFQAPGMYVQAINASTTISENYWMAFVDESTWGADASQSSKFTIYRRAGYGTSAQKVQDITYDERFIASDGVNDNVLPLVMNNNGNTLYLATWRYEKTFFENPDDPTNDTMSPDNNFIIQLYKGTSTDLTMVKETKIPVTPPSGEFNWRSYGLGMFLGAGDLSFDFGTGSLPAYIVSVVDSDILENQSTYFAVYDTDGKQIKTFGLNNAGFTGMSEVKGQPMQICFDMASAATGETGLVMCDYPSFNEAGFIPKLFENEGDIWSLGAVPDRVMTAEGIRYMAPIQPANGGEAARIKNIGWFKPDGTLERVDRLEFQGKVAKVNSFLSGAVMDPYLFNSDKKQEFIHWVYTYKSDSDSDTTTDLVVTDNKGNVLAQRRMPDEVAGSPMCLVSNIASYPSIALFYNCITAAGRTSNMEIIRLPLNKFEGEGTAESPYMLRTFGDLDQVRNNLSSHFALANSIDCEGRVFRPIEGNFTGSLDGRGNEITNLLINTSKTGDAMFRTLGRRLTVEEIEAEAKPLTGSISNLTLYQPTFTGEASTGVKDYAVLVNEARNAAISNVHVIDPAVTVPANFLGSFGVIANSVYDTDITGSSVLDADINIPTASALGGIVSSISGGSVKASAFTGKLAARANIGGIAVQNQGTPVIKDCHVNAELTGQNTIGGIIATSSRAAISHSLVEGTINASTPVEDYDADDNFAYNYNVGGIAGKLEAASYEDPDAEDFMAIANCTVALEAINLSSDSEYAGAKAAHRIVGWTSIDGGSTIEWVEDPTSTADEQKMKPIVHPAAPEARMANNHVISSLAAIETAEVLPVSEGTTFADTADQTWFTGLGYAFDGDSAQEPWVFEAERPALFFEATATSALYFAEAEIEGVEGTEINVPLVFRGIEPESIMFSSTDEEGAMITNFVEPGEVVVSLMKPGTYTITATNYYKTATLKVTVQQFVSVDQIGADKASAIIFDGTTVKAEGCAIAVYSTQGQLVAAGNDAVAASQLLPGVYVAKAIAADGTASTLKFATK